MDRENPEIYSKQIRQLYRSMLTLISLLTIAVVAVLLYSWIGNPFKGIFDDKKQMLELPQKKNVDDDWNKVVDGIHLMTGLKVAKGFKLVKTNCTPCHSAKLVTQNRATRQGWSDMIDWMQATQGLWDLGDQEPTILDYLANHYGPEEIGRRANLEEIEWYLLQETEE